VTKCKFRPVGQLPADVRWSTPTSLIAVVPVLAVALVAQRRVVEGLTLGAVR
jgi:ABC-type glycerol-3-phosphate transport system permease component